MRRMLCVAATGAVLLLAGCAAPVEDQARQACTDDLRFEIEQNVPGTTDEWLAYDLKTEIDLVETEMLDDGGMYTFEGTATLTAAAYPTKTVDFTCLGIDLEGLDEVSGSIVTINGKCTVARVDSGRC